MKFVEEGQPPCEPFLLPFKNFPSAPVVKNPPSHAGETGLIPGWETKIPRAARQLNPRTATTVLN